MAKIDELYAKARQLNAGLIDVHAAIAFEQANLRNQVLVERKGQTVTLHYEDRVFKAKKTGKFGRWSISEGRKVLVKESFRSLNEIRLDIALGKL